MFSQTYNQYYLKNIFWKDKSHYSYGLKKKSSIHCKALFSDLRGIKRYVNPMYVLPLAADIKSSNSFKVTQSTRVLAKALTLDDGRVTGSWAEGPARQQREMQLARPRIWETQH